MNFLEMAESQYLRCDEKGFPGTLQADGSFDGGDTAAILGTIIALSPAAPMIVSVWGEKLPMLLSSGGKPRRHWDASKWYGQADRFSRDQLIPIICACIVWRKLTFYCVNHFYEAHQQRWFLTAWNTKKNGLMETPNKFPDLTGPEIWALWIRFRQPFWARLVLVFLDFELLIGVISWRFRKDRVSRNIMLSTITCREVMPTLTSRLAFVLLNFDDLIKRWNDHCEAVGEYQTSHLFRWKLEVMR